LTDYLQPYGHRLTYNLPLSKLYTATLLAALNAREGWNWPENYLQSAAGVFNSIAAASNAPSTGGFTPNLSALGFAANPALQGPKVRTLSSPVGVLMS
jgi:hypothetical protein